MIYSIVLTEAAQADLSAIFQYISVELQSVQNASAQFSRLENAIASLGQMPERYRVYDRKPWRGRNLRIMPVDNYLVFYIPTRSDSIVTVVRVMYGGRDIGRQLEMAETESANSF